MATEGPLPRNQPQSTELVERALLFGLAGLQTTLIGVDQLLAAVRGWCEHEDGDVAQAYERFGSLSANQVELLSSLVQHLLRSQGGDLHASLVQLFEATAARDAELLLRGLTDVEHDGLQACLGSLPAVPRHASRLGAIAGVTGGIESEWGVEESQLTHQSSVDREDSVPLEPTFEALASGTLGQRFEILETMARGGLGVVSLAYDKELRREVALKRIRPDKSDRELYRRRFMLEAIITGGLQHPGIPPVYALGLDRGGLPYYAMRRIRGEQFKERIERFHARLRGGEVRFSDHELESLLRRFIDVCDTVCYAHSRGVIHRDLKPANVMLGAYGETIVVDWGVAKVLGQSPSDRDAENADAETSSEAGRPERAAPEAPMRAQASTTETPPSDGVVGTLAYAPPEQIVGSEHKVDERSDVYGLGGLLYEILTGAAPHAGKTKSQLLMGSKSDRIRKPRELTPTIPRGLEAIVLKALQFAPAQRYACVEDLRRDLESWLDSRPISVPGEPAGERLRRWTRRNPKFVVAGSLAGMAFMLMLAILMVVVERNREVLASKNQELVSANSQIEATLRISEQQAEEARKHSEAAFRTTLILAEELRETLSRTLPGERRRRNSLLHMLPGIREAVSAYDGQDGSWRESIQVQMEFGEVLLAMQNAPFTTRQQLLIAPVDPEVFPVVEQARACFETARRVSARRMREPGNEAELRELRLHYADATRGWIAASHMLGRVHDAAEASKQLLKNLESVQPFEALCREAASLPPPRRRRAITRSAHSDQYWSVDWDSPHGPVRVHLWAHQLAAETLLAAGEVAQPRVAAERALKLHEKLRSVDSPDERYRVSLAQTYALLANCAWLSGETSRAIEFCESARQVRIAAMEEFKTRYLHLPIASDLLADISSFTLQTLDFERTRELAEELLADGTEATRKRQGDPRGPNQVAVASVILAQLALASGGDSHTAKEYFHKAIEAIAVSREFTSSPGESQRRQARLVAVERAGRLALRLQEIDMAVELGEEALVLAEEIASTSPLQLHGNLMLCRVKALLAAAKLRQGHVSSASEHLRAAVSALRPYQGQHPNQVFAFRRGRENAVVMAEIPVERGDFEGALRWLSDANLLTARVIDESAAEHDDALLSVRLYQCQSRAHRGLGQIENAVAAQRRAIEWANELLVDGANGNAMPHDAGPMYCDLAELLIERGQFHEAVEAAKTASEQLLRLRERDALNPYFEAALVRAEGLAEWAQNVVDEEGLLHGDEELFFAPPRSSNIKTDGRY